MPSSNKINFKSFVFSFLLSTILTLLIFFTLQSFSIKLSVDIILFIFFALGIVTFTLIYLYLKFVIENRIKDIYKSIIPENDFIENSCTLKIGEIPNEAPEIIFSKNNQDNNFSEDDLDEYEYY